MKALLLFLLMIPMGLFAQEEDENAIKAVINSAYLEGITNEGNGEKIDAGFHPGFKMLGYNSSNDRLWEFPIYYWKQGALENAADGTIAEREPVRFEFPMIDVTGNVAVVKVLYFRGDKQLYTDYLSLYKFKDGWKIVSKIFYQHPEE